MSAIKKQYPPLRWIENFPRGGEFWIYLPDSLKSLPTDKKELLHYLTQHFLKSSDWDSDNAYQKRTLKALESLAIDIDINSGYSLISFFASQYAWRDKKIKTHIEYDTDLEETAVSIEDAPYCHDYVDDFVTVREGDEIINMLYEGIKHDCIVAVEHKTREEMPEIRCDHCQGAGTIKCPACEGSGREQYVDGYYASGDERIKTGRCSECGGSGRIPCPECGGTGKKEIYANNFSLVRAVEEIISSREDAFFVLPKGHEQKIQCTYEDLSKDYIDVATGKFGIIASSQGEQSFLKESRKVFCVDNRDAIKKELAEAGFELEYERMLKRVESIPQKERGDAFSRREIHYMFPMIIITVTYGENEKVRIYLYENNKGTQAIMTNLAEISVRQSLLLKLSSLLKK